VFGLPEGFVFYASEKSKLHATRGAGGRRKLEKSSDSLGKE
jgi:hypothetical protein